MSPADVLPELAGGKGVGRASGVPPPLPPPAAPPALPLLPLLLAGSVAASGGAGFAAQLVALLVPDHWCRDASADALQEQLPLDAHAVLQFTAPLTRPHPSGFSFSQCERFEGDMAAAYIQWIMRRYKSHVSNSSRPTIACDQGWHYNLTGGFSTISSELNWVCSDGWKPNAVHFTFFISASLGMFLWPAISKRCGQPRALLLALCVGVAGAAATLLTPRGLAPFLAARASAATTFLAGPHLALSLIARGKVRCSGATPAAAAAWAAVGVAVLQSGAAVATVCAGLLFPWWWLSAAAAVLAALPLLLLCWLIFRSYILITDKDTDISLSLERPLIPDDNTTVRSITRSFFGLSASTAYFGLWLAAPRMVGGPPWRAAAWLALGECTAWPLPALLLVAPQRRTSTSPAAGGPDCELRRAVSCGALATCAALLLLLGTMLGADVSFWMTATLVTRSAGNVALSCGRPHCPQLPTVAAATYALEGIGAALAVLFTWLGEEINVHLTLLCLGVVVSLGAFCAVWESGRPWGHRVNYYYGYMKTSFKCTVATCTQEGYAKFKNSSFPYGPLQKI